MSFTIPGTTGTPFGVGYDRNGIPKPGNVVVKPDRVVTFAADLRRQMDGLLPEGFGFLRVPIGVDTFGWMLAYRPNFGDQKGVSPEERERAWQAPQQGPTAPAQPLINPQV